MRLDFNVLWVEDQQGAVEAQREKIETIISREGFRLKTQFSSSVDEAVSFLSNDIYGDHIDLVMMDYDLGAGKKGDQGLVEVRNLFPYKDIIFYSAREDLKTLVAEKMIQGIFCTSRTDLTDTVYGVFDALIKKVIDIDHSRGIVMGTTSDIDHFVHDCLNILFQSSDDELKGTILTNLEKHIKEKEASFAKDISALKQLSDISQILSMHNIYTSNDRLRLLKNALKTVKKYEEQCAEITNYMTNTVPKRNSLAHVKVRMNGFSRKLYDRKDIELTSDNMKEIRKELLKYHEIFEKLLLELSS